MPSTFIHHILKNAGAFSLDPIIRHKSGHRRGFRDLRWNDLEGMVTSLAMGLIDRGLEPGGRVGLLSRNRPEWLVADLATMMAGGVVVPIPYTTAPDHCRLLIERSQLDMLVVEDQVQLYKVRLNRSSRLETIILMDGPGPDNDRRAVTLTDLQEEGWSAGSRYSDMLRQRVDGLTPNTPATIVYVNEEGVQPRGCMIGHGNIMVFLNAVARGLPMGDPLLEQSLLVLPLHHIYPRLLGAYFNLYHNIPLVIGDSLDSLAENLVETRPTFLCGTPVILEKMHRQALSLAESVGRRRFDLFQRAVATGNRLNQYKDLKQDPPYLMEKQHWLADKLVFVKISNGFGGRLRLVISAGSLLSPDLEAFFTTLGIRVINVYGRTETLGGAMSSLDCYRPGTIGKPMAGYEMDLAPDGEILIRGNLFSGYLEPSDSTKRIRRGWFYTGDLGRRDLDGFWEVLGRKDHLIILADGGRVHPEKIEHRLRSQRMIGEAVVWGHGREYLTALLTLDRQETERFALAAGIEYPSFEMLTGDPAVLDRVALDVDAANQRGGAGENIRYFRVIPGGFSYEGGELTATLKVRRRGILDKYWHLVDDMYQPSRVDGASTEPDLPAHTASLDRS